MTTLRTRPVLAIFGLAVAIAVLLNAAAFAEQPAGRAGAAQKQVFRAGAATVDITPQKLPVIVNGGMAERTASRVTDRLHARCLVLDDGATRLAIAVVDSCVLPRPLLDEAKRFAHEATGIPPDRMLISATHTHSAPSVLGVLGSDRDRAYAERLPGKIAAAIKAADARLAPARVGWAVGREPRHVFCRRFLMKPGTARTNPFGGTHGDRAQMNPGYRNPNAVERTGPVDPAVTVLSVQTAGGQPMALVANYSTHYVGAPPVSADYFGVFAERIAKLLGAESVEPPFVGILSNGTSGDANCCDFQNPPVKLDRFAVADDVAHVALEACKKIKYHDWVPLVMAERRLTLAARMPSGEEVERAKKFLAGMAGRKPRTIPEVYARETVLLAEMPPTRELKLQAIRIGGLGIAAIPNEVYGATGLAIKAKSPLKPTFNICLANGYFGYIPLPEQFALGGYTTWRARSSCLEVGAEPKIRAAVLELLEKVSQPTRPSQPAGQ